MKKIIFTIVISFIIIISTTVIFAGSLSAYNKEISSEKIVKYESVYIEEGDCISLIAEQYNTSSMSTSEFTKYLKKFNSLRNDKIYYGNNILIPIFE